MRRLLLLTTLTLLTTACRREREKPAAKAPAGEATAQKMLDDSGLYFTTESETNDRVAIVFPNGVASEDARKTIGTAQPPPTSTAPDRTTAILVSVDLAKPMDVATVRAAVMPGPKALYCFVKGLTTRSVWEYAEDANATGPYSRVVLEIPFIKIDAAALGSEIDQALVWAQAAAAKLDKRPPTISMTRDQAIAQANTAFKVKRELGDDQLEEGVIIVAPKGQKFAGRLVWDVVYSAGFFWGDGDYFHWVPSPETDVSQGIGMGTSTGSSYFMPEWVAKNDGSADVEDLEMSFSVARAWDPQAVFGVMVRSANYMAHRLGGTVMAQDGTPFDQAKARERVTSIVKSLTAAGMTPGSALTLQVF